ncbi:MAG: hypothetical protein FJ263_06410 [Planctomycetes bacterium]|nr:hypothetical protein [Planctomycetota bacterium]
MIDEEDEMDLAGGQYDYGPQPIAAIMEQRKLRPTALVAASTEQITHKMVSRACKGRKLSRRVQLKIMRALNTVTQQEYKLKDLFTY